MTIFAFVRWILVLPIACLGALVSYFLVKVLILIGGVILRDTVSLDWLELIGSLAGAIAFAVAAG